VLVNLNQTFTDLLDGGKLYSDREKVTALTMKYVLINSLQTLTEKDREADGVQKTKWGAIALKIFNSKNEIDLTPVEVTTCIGRVDNLYGPSVVEPVRRILNKTTEAENASSKKGKK